VAVFLSTYLNKVDRKGRVSVPAAFRAALAGSGSAGIVAIEAAGLDRVEEMSRRLDSLPELSEEREALATLLADMEQLAFDGEGRIMLPPGLAKHAGIEGDATFVGGGPTFQIWEAGRFKRHQEEMRARIRERGLTLPPRETK
jgi:MraZ protein